MAYSALNTGQECSNCQTDLVFRSLGKHERLDDDSMKTNQFNLIIKITTKCHIPNAELYSSHSLRCGFATESQQTICTFRCIMRQGGASNTPFWNCKVKN
ncbi:hypothetical protein BH10PSE19_BH10PSE19_08860 [soil metagenome]